MAKLKVGKDKADRYRKTKRVSFTIPVEDWEKCKLLKKKYKIKSLQAIFDYLVVSGVIYFDRSVMEVVDENIEDYIDRYKQMQLSKLGKCDPPEFPKSRLSTFTLYPKDYKALHDYCIEKNYAKQWIYELLFRGFANEDPRLIDIVLRNQKLNVRQRKKQMARLSEDKWIKMLDVSDAKSILKQLTENYEERKFDKSIEEDIFRLKEKHLARIREEDEIEKELNKKIEQINQMRGAKIGKIAQPRIDIE